MPRHFVASALLIGLASSPAIAADDVPIVHLLFRDHIVTISTSDTGPRYTVMAKDGSFVALNLNDDQLLAAYPDLYSHLKSGVAGVGGEKLIWAGNETSNPGEFGVPEPLVPFPQSH